MKQKLIGFAKSKLGETGGAELKPWKYQTNKFAVKQRNLCITFGFS